MPKSARSKVVTLTKTAKKTREDKERIADEIRRCADTYAYIWVLNVENMRNKFLKEIRQDWAGSRILFGRTKLMQKILGRTKEDEYQDNVHELAELLHGDVGLLFTNDKPDVVREYFDSFARADFARAGTPAPVTFTVPEGIVYSTGGQQPADDDLPLPHSMEITVRNLGMPTRLLAGKVTLSAPYTICTEGQVLDSSQAQLLKLFGLNCAKFKVHLRGFYSKQDSAVSVLMEERADE